MRVIIFFALIFVTYLNGFSQQKPNFIIIYVDDMGYGDIGINGNPNIHTPNLTKMANEGTIFTNYYSASPACTASRYALLTGKYPPRAGFRWVLNPDSPHGLNSKEKTLASYLKDVGYKTGIFGKWHLGSTKLEYLPLQNGFDEYLGLPYSNDMIPPKYQDIAFISGNDTVGYNPDQSQLTRVYTEAALDFISKHTENPFFVYLTYPMPHTPLHPSDKFKGKSKRGEYGDVVEELDHYIGKLIDYLKQEGLSENTYVIFTSDNGPWLIQKEKSGSAGLFRDGKGSTWEGGVRVPFILWGHNNVKKQSVVAETFTALDILPSFMSLSSTNGLSNPIDGLDLSNLFKSEGKGRDVFYYYGIDHQLFAVRKGKWKLHVKTYSQLKKDYFNNKLPLLFNLNEDPSEKYDLSDKYPKIVEELSILIEDNRIDSNSKK